MKIVNALMLVVSGLALSGCGITLQDPNPSPPRVMPDGKTYYPPPGGWPNFDKGGETGGTGRN